MATPLRERRIAALPGAFHGRPGPWERSESKVPHCDQTASTRWAGRTTLVGLGDAAWALKKYLDQQATERAERNDLARQRLEHEKREEANRRRERAAELVLEFGRTEDSASRWLTASAMTLYADEITPVLISALGHAGPKTASAIATALVAIGEPTTEQLIQANRVASTIGRGDSSIEGHLELFDSSGQLLQYSRSVLAHILVLHTTRQTRAALDLADVDLAGSNFVNADLEGIRLRKAILDGCNFSRTKLQDANLRGASAVNATFTRANASRADFTGLSGPVHMIRTHARHATFDNAQLANSRLDAADLSDAGFERTRFHHAALDGAQLVGARLQKCRLDGVSARKSKWSNATVEHCHISSADLRRSTLGGATFTNCAIRGTDLSDVRASGARFVNCNLGGSTFERAVLTDTVFHRSILGGARFGGADLNGVVFDSCDLRGFHFGDANLEGVVFRGRQVFRADDIDPNNSSWRSATFEGAADALEQALRDAAAAR